MNRRNFINNLIVAGASFTILPGAGRIWRATREFVPIRATLYYFDRTVTEIIELPRDVCDLGYTETFRKKLFEALDLAGHHNCNAVSIIKILS